MRSTTTSCILAVLMLVGCRSTSRRGASFPAPTAPTTWPTTQLSSSTGNGDVDAYVSPPLGWSAQPLKQSSRHSHQLWIAPSGATAYGVIRFSLPFPVGYDLALWGFLREMKRTQGEAILVTKEWDENSQALRFVADGGEYRVRVNLMLDGWHGWAVYAGTRRDHEIVSNELEVAQLARDHTIVGMGSSGTDANR
jgi:hypothetical protein